MNITLHMLVAVLIYFILTLNCWPEENQQSDRTNKERNKPYTHIYTSFRQNTLHVYTANTICPLHACSVLLFACHLLQENKTSLENKIIKMLGIQ